MFPSVLTTWLRSRSRSRGTSRSAPRSNGFLPRVEQLEGRLVLSPVASPNLLSQPAATSNALQQTLNASATKAPQFRVKIVVKLNTFVDDVKAEGVNGTRYSVSLTVPAGQFKPGDIITETPAPSQATYYMVIRKTDLPGTQSGSLQLSRIVKWYNGKPVIRGLSYPYSLTAPKWWYDTVKVKDIVREVYRRSDVPPSWRWGKWNTNPAIENLLLTTGAGLPNLEKGGITVLGPPTADFNCYAFAAANGSLTKAQELGWSGFGPHPSWVTKPGKAFRPGTSDLLDFFRDNGWVPTSNPGTPKPGERFVILYGTPNGSITHAALWTDSGVSAKMGPGGTFRFDKPGQMNGSLYGQPVMWLRRSIFGF